MTHANRVMDVHTIVTEADGRWAVDVVVISAGGVARDRVASYPTKEHAELSARIAQRTIDRDLKGPLNG